MEQNMETDNITNDYVWSIRDKKILEDNYKYHKDMIEIIEKNFKRGPENTILPDKPKSNLKSLFEVQEKEYQLVYHSKDLHKYLGLKIVNFNEYTTNPGNILLCETLQDTLNYLLWGYAEIKKIKANALRDSIMYGEWLTFAFNLHTKEKLSGKIVGTWKSWLLVNVGISHANDSRLRLISELLRDFPLFKRLNISFSEVYRLRREISNMLTVRELADVWRTQI